MWWNGVFVPSFTKRDDIVLCGNPNASGRRSSDPALAVLLVGTEADDAFCCKWCCWWHPWVAEIFLSEPTINRLVGNGNGQNEDNLPIPGSSFAIDFPLLLLRTRNLGKCFDCVCCSGIYTSWSNCTNSATPPFYLVGCERIQVAQATGRHQIFQSSAAIS